MKKLCKSVGDNATVLTDKSTRLIAQRRFLIPETLAFLAEARGDSSPDVWKNALDGIVTLGGAEAAVVLSAAKSELKDNKRIRWLEETIEQIEELKRPSKEGASRLGG